MGVIILFALAIHQSNTAWMYLCTKDIIKGKPESFFEIGYFLFKRPSIFLISSVLVLNAFGLTMVYFITFSEIMSSFCKDLIGDGDKPLVENWLVQKQFWVLVLAAIILPICLKREVAELHIVSVTLFASIVVFILIIFL